MAQKVGFFVSKFREIIVERPVASITTLISLTLFILHITKKISLDSIAVAILIAAVFPWIITKLSSFLEYFSEKLRNANIKSIEIPHVLSVELGRLKDKIETHEKRLDEQSQMMDELVIYSMASYLINIIKDFYYRNKEQSGEWLYRPSHEHSLRYLRDHGYLQHFSIRTLKDAENLVGKVKLTPMGERFVELHLGIIKRKY